MPRTSTQVTTPVLAIRPYESLHISPFRPTEDHGHTGKEGFTMGQQKMKGQVSHGDEEVDFPASIFALQKVYQAAEI